jgi:hypothetical protein
MATGNDYIACDYNEFVKNIKNIQNGKENAYENIVKLLNTQYIDVSKNIIKLNEERIELLNKIKFIQSEYRHLMGEGEITVSVDIDDNSDEEDKIVVEPKVGVRGRKKKIETDKSAKKAEETEQVKVEEPVEEPKKNKVKKTTKKEVEEAKEEAKEEVKEEVKDEIEEEKVEKGNKGKKNKKK